MSVTIPQGPGAPAVSGVAGRRQRPRPLDPPSSGGTGPVEWGQWSDVAGDNFSRGWPVAGSHLPTCQPFCLREYDGSILCRPRKDNQAMASTQITVENRTAIPIYALLTWAGGHVGGANIPAIPAPTPRPGAEGTGRHRDFQSASIPCEYVWYDFWIIDPAKGLTRDGGSVVGGHTLAKKQARGSTSWFFEGTEAEGYRLVQQ